MVGFTVVVVVVALLCGESSLKLPLLLPIRDLDILTSWALLGPPGHQLLLVTKLLSQQKPSIPAILHHLYITLQTQIWP